ncbi:MAG: 2-oxoglutarate and iron-dependent oxygenase domain-containing protein, partial [Bacteroidia bacterium]
MSDHSHNIPSIDLANFTSGDSQRKAAFVKELGEAYENIGFVAIKSHYLTDEIANELYKQAKAFFDLPEDVKKKYEIEGLAGQRGYTSFGKEHAKGRTEGDLKEFWHFGQEVEDNDPIKNEYPENVHVAELPEFYDAGMAAYKAIEKTGKEMLRSIAIYLGL